MIAKLRIGAHVSTANGFLQAVAEARRIGANTIQIFGASPVQWRAPLPEVEESEKFRDACDKADIRPVFLHAPYLINLASPKEQLGAMSRTLLEKHLEISNALSADGVIFHIGSSGTRSQKDTERKVIAALLAILEKVPTGRLLVENSAGAGNLVGDTLEEIARILSGLDEKRAGFCYDTAHGFEAGILTDFSTKGIGDFVKRVDGSIGVERLWAIHANDSATPASSNKDRHANIGQGHIGAEGFRNLLRNKMLRKLPFILEVPGFDEEGPDKKNVQILHSLAGEITTLR